MAEDDETKKDSREAKKLSWQNWQPLATHFFCIFLGMIFAKTATPTKVVKDIHLERGKVYLPFDQRKAWQNLEGSPQHFLLRIDPIDALPQCYVPLLALDYAQYGDKKLWVFPAKTAEPIMALLTDKSIRVAASSALASLPPCQTHVKVRFGA